MRRFSHHELIDLASAIARRAGVPSDDAAILADSLVAADLSGTSTHGVSRLAIYVKRIRKGLIDPKALLRVERERAGTLAIDAGNGLGQVQAVKALNLLMPKRASAAWRQRPFATRSTSGRSRTTATAPPRET
jgi:LDH2 family malate/lactate/ureidoglycolate dehydrogenase